MKYYLIAGEASGDLHASNLIREIRKWDDHAEFRCWGGNRMKEQGAILVNHYRDTAFMGFTEVLAHVHKIVKYIRFCKKDILAWQPDALILVDYPGFNLRMAGFASKKGFRVFYYISPQVWAWKPSRVQKIKDYVNRMFVILPFEKEFYAARGVEVDYVGHPLLDALEETDAEADPIGFRKKNNLDGRPLIALLPGSRKQEVIRVLPIMRRITGYFPEYQFVVAGLSSLPDDLYTGILSHSNIRIVMDETYGLLHHATAALVTSGTATLETALLDVPEVICYKGGSLSYQIARRLVKVPFIGLVNLIMQKEIVRELIQHNLNETNLRRELVRILPGGPDHKQIKMDYADLKKVLGGKGASERTARLLLARLQ